MIWQTAIEFGSGLMAWCCARCPNDWWAVLAFTGVTKVLLLPLSLWCHVNGLRMVALMPSCNRLRIRLDGDGEAYANETAALFREAHYHPLLALVPVALQVVILLLFVDVINGLNGSPALSAVPARDGGRVWLMPLVAGAAAWLFGFCQNRINPLQREQTRRQQIVTNGISIAISLGLGCFVAAGVGFYWAASNVFSIVVQLVCNALVRPSSRVDYPELRRSQAELSAFQGTRSGGRLSAESRRREREDYRRFFHVANKHLVFYSEGGGYFKYFRRVIAWVLENSNLTVHYVTGDPQDEVFGPSPLPFASSSRFRTYFIGPGKIIRLMMRMDADMVVMTTPDLETYHFKRSYVKKDVEYVYLDHGTSSMSMVFRKGAFDHFDTIFMSGPFLVDEFRKSEALYGTKRKTLVPTGYAYLGDLMERYAPTPAKPYLQILIAPSHQPGNILESCLDEMLASLATVPNARIVLRPHPQFVRRHPNKWRQIKAKAKGEGEAKVRIDDDFSRPAPLDETDVVISDWSSIAYEFSLVTKRPSILVNTPMKVINPEYSKLGLEPTDIAFRDRIGRSLDVAEVKRTGDVVREMMSRPERFAAQVDDLLATSFYDPLKAGQVAGDYIIDTLIAKESSSPVPRP